MSAIATLSFQLTALAAPLAPCAIPSLSLQISQFSFNSAIDFIELTVLDDGNSGKGTELKGWKLTTIDATLTTLNQQITTGQKIHLPEIGNLTATTDQIVLVDSQGQTHDAVCWVNAKPTSQEQEDFFKLTTSWAGDLSTCLSSTTLEKNTIFERTNSIDTDTRADWKAANTITEPVLPPTPPAPALTTMISSNDHIATNELTLSEFLPDPEGNDEGNEWIEIRNTSDHAVRLTGWQLDDAEGGSKPFTFTTQTIGPESFLLLKNSLTNITLNNSTDSVRLFNTEKKIVSVFTYEKTESGQSWAITKSNTWELTTRTTPEEENIFTEESTKNEESKKLAEPTKPIEATEPTVVEISELLPNPAGADTGKEWIEIHNKTDESISLASWKIQNKEGKIFILPVSASIPGNGYLILTDETTKIRMKNSDDEIQLIDAENIIQDQVEFEEAPENTSFAEIATIPVMNTDHTEKPATTFLQRLIGTAHAQHAEVDRPAETSWEWTRTITQGKPNPKHYTIEGKITQSLGETRSFIIMAQNKEFSIRVPEEMLTPTLAKNIFQAGEQVKITVQKNGDTYLLEAYATNKEHMGSEKGKEKESSPLALVPVLIVIATISGTAYYKFIRRDDRAFSELDGTLLHKSPPEPQPR